MKNKAPLALMEQLIMILVFALAAALCLRLFVYSDQVSVNGAARDQAAAVVQNAAETLKACGDAEAGAQALDACREGEGWYIGYDEAWQVTREQPAYRVVILPGEEDGFLGSAQVTAEDGEGESLFAVTVMWQEATHG